VKSSRRDKAEKDYTKPGNSRSKKKTDGVFKESERELPEKIPLGRERKSEHWPRQNEKWTTSFLPKERVETSQKPLVKTREET